MAQPEIYELPAYPSPAVIADPEYRNGIAAPKINGAMEIAGGTIFADALVIGAQTWFHNLVWSATDEDTAAWTSGTLELASGATYSISSGDTGNIVATTYVYFNGTSTLQVTTTQSDAVTDDNILLAIIEPQDTGGAAVITAFAAVGTTIDGDRIKTGRIQSPDGGTAFDLINDYIIMNDGTTNRVLLGRIPA